MYLFLKSSKWFVIDKRFTLLLLILFPGFSFAQLDQVKSIEIQMEKHSNDRNYNVHVLKDNSIMLVTENDHATSSKYKRWTFSKYDTSFAVQWQKEMEIRFYYSAIKSYDNDNYFYILFKEKEAQKVTVVRIDYKSGDLESFDGVLPTKIEDINEFKVLSNMALIAGKINQRPVVMAFRFFDKKIQVLPALYDKNMQLNNININDQKNIVDIVVAENNKKKNKLGLKIKSYAYSGKLLQDVTLSAPKNKILQTGKISHTTANENEDFMIGNFADSRNEYTLGLYFAKMNNNEQQFIKYYDFAELKNFFNYLKPKNKIRTKERLQRRLAMGKQSNLRYKLLIHNIVQHNNEFILVAEAYYPEYKTNMYNSYGYGGYGMNQLYGYQNPFYNPSYLYNGLYNGNNINRNYRNDRILEGYKYSHAIVCSFNMNGDLLWDNCFPIGGDLLNKTLEELVKVAFEEDGKMILMYPHDDKMHTEVIKGGEVIAEKEKFDINKIQTDQRIRSSDIISMQHWYNNYFISWGFREMRRKNNDENFSSHKVFYLSKITYHVNNLASNKKETK